MKIALATRDDILKIMSLIRDCIADMESRGIHQWSKHYPTRGIIEEDIENRSLYTMVERDEILGIITINQEQPTQYKGIRWSIQDGMNLIIHRLAVSPTWHRKGIARRLLDYAEKYAVDNRYDSVRLDAYSGNPRAVNLYEKRGYRCVGQVHFPRRDLSFYCYEKLLRSNAVSND